MIEEVIWFFFALFIVVGAIFGGIFAAVYGLTVAECNSYPGNTKMFGTSCYIKDSNQKWVTLNSYTDVKNQKTEVTIK